MALTRIPSTIAVLLSVLSLAPAAALAQVETTTPQPAEVRRPYRGLFGGSPDPSAPSLILSGSLYGAYDDNVLARGEGPEGARDPRGQRPGAFTGGDINLAYARSGERGSFNASGGAQSRYIPDIADNVVAAFTSHVDFTRKVGGRTSFGASHSLLFAPNYRLNMLKGADVDLDGGVTGVDFDQDLFGQEAYRHAADASLTRSIGRRSSLSFVYRARYVDFVESGRRDLIRHGASGRFSSRMTSSATLVLGYTYRRAESNTGGPPSEVHDIDAGVNYGRALSFSRRTSFNFSTGSAIVAARRDGALSSDLRTRLRLTGNASLTHEMGRTWTASLGYRRGLTYQDGLSTPFDTDGAAADLAGLFSRRTDASMSMQWTRANYTNGGKAYEALSGSAQIRYALTRMLAVYARYTYFRYDLDASLATDPASAGAFDRGGARVGLSVNVPLLR